MKTRLKCSQSIRPKKSQSVREGSFSKVLSEIEVYFLLNVGFFPSSICVHVSVKYLGRVIENTAGDGCQETDTAQFQSLLGKLILWWEKWTSITIIKNISAIPCISHLHGVWNRNSFALPPGTWEPSRFTPHIPPCPGGVRLAPCPTQISQITPAVCSCVSINVPPAPCHFLLGH